MFHVASEMGKSVLCFPLSISGDTRSTVRANVLLDPLCLIIRSDKGT